MTAFDPTLTVAQDLGLREPTVRTVLKLLSEGNTVPFLARYRKEATGGLDEVVIGNIESAAKSAEAFDARRQTILQSIEGQGLLTKALRQQILACTTKESIEDLYLPFKKKRKTRASMARERGLQPLADRILAQPSRGEPQAEARAHIGGEVPDADAALAGAKDIVAEAINERADVRAMARNLIWSHARIDSRAIKKTTEGQRSAYESYYAHCEPLKAIPSHRYLALCRGEQEGLLKVTVDIDRERLAARIAHQVGYRRGSPWATLLREAVLDCGKRLLGPSLDNELRGVLRARSEEEAAQVFAANLKGLLLAAPYGRHAVVGVDPGFRSGCKCAAVTDTGQFLTHTTIHPHTRKGNDAQVLARFVLDHNASAVAVGNGTAGRETLSFVRDALKQHSVDAIVVSVNEAGASIYSASEVAREEFPSLDLTIRGAISIARRLQDPLAELVKVDPAALGVGQYQHDITPRLLKDTLDRVVALCVNRVGVQLNTASAALLQHVAGIGPTLARRIVEHRDTAGGFTSRKELLKVKGLGPKAFEQAAGFLRVAESAHPLDNSAVHPERYALVATIAKSLGVPLARLVGNASLVSQINPQHHPVAGALTMADIIDELQRPGRDPRDSFTPPAFRDDVNTVADLSPGMVLQGVITNVAAFGAFVDIGVHQDGLIHISKLAARRVNNPHDVVTVGQSIKVKVLEVDRERNRISLSARDA